MNFDDLIQRYSSDFEIIPKTGSYVAGEYVAVDGEPITMRGAIVKMPLRKVYGSGGYYSAKDLRLFITSKITHKEATVRYKDNVYSVEDMTDYQDFAGCFVYVLRWVSVFDKEAGEHE